MAIKQQVSEDEGINRLHEVIFCLRYGNAMDIENLLNYHCENVAMMKSSTDEKIIQEVMGTSVDNDHDPNVSYSYQMFPQKRLFKQWQS